MKAALQLFATDGYHKTKVSDIVKVVGVAQGTFYWYFSSKEDIALAIIAVGKEKLLAVVQQGYREKAGSLDEMLRSSYHLIYSYLQFAKRNRDLMAFIFLKGQGADPAIKNEIIKIFVSIEHAFANNIKRATQLKMLQKSQKAELKAMMLTSLLNGTMERWLFGPQRDLHYLSNESIETVAHHLVQFEFFGLLSGGDVDGDKG
ncbi:TetR/AcrR family transcriptional regulator [Alkalihalobacillus pseudalcaliphilus]|uniref:TetR/AcrR family transcriptional regulator n=1 Tax=Alkalihalobacillus pseudalcaliphilus TaxID=79884 RepID=UPI00064E0BAA|nr:TetR/AcrR family transcriptional regulator [Alkalihalobacillus pseudalcaliphilus]KMK74982.1 TetR family transcriptional regulator [Alkalihalobacillus pseudalcaliphilus]